MEKMKRLVMAVFKTHFDYGYTDTKENVLKLYSGRILDDVIKLCEDTQKLGNEKMYKWTLPSYLLIKMYEDCPNDKKLRFYNLVKNDQISCHALPFTMHTELLDKNMAENMFIFTQEYCKIFDKPFPISAKMTDVPGHSVGIVKYLVNNGVKFLHIGKNGASLAPDVPELFWWEDYDGNRILTMYNQTYGSKMTPPKKWKFPVYLALCHTNDNKGVQDFEYIKNLQNSVGDDYKFCTGTLNDFAKELLKCDLSSLPIIKGELSNTWVHGIGSYPGATSVFRNSRRDFYNLEEFAKRNEIDIENFKNRFYKQALLFTEHTFGANILKFLKDERVYDKEELLCKIKEDSVYQYIEKTWNDEKDIAKTLNNICKETKEYLNYQSDEFHNKSLPEISMQKNKIEVNFNNKKYLIYYEYKIFGANSVHTFVKKYLTRYENWSISDFGRMWYPEIEDENFIAIPTKTTINGNEIIVDFAMDERSYNIYGNCKSIKLHLYIENSKLKFELNCNEKQPTTYVETGNLIIETEENGEFIVEQIGNKVDVQKNIIKNANHILWAMDSFAQIGNSTLKSLDCPLISFGENAICKFNGGNNRKYKPNFVVNLFNNHWGTNFPQWIKGDFTFKFELT